MCKFGGPWLGNHIWPLINLACSAENTVFWQSVSKLKDFIYCGSQINCTLPRNKNLVGNTASELTFQKCEQQWEGITHIQTLTATDKSLYTVFRWIPNTQSCGYRHLNWISFSVTEDGYIKLTCLHYTERKNCLCYNEERILVLSILGYI